ncbi:MAG: ferrous iron transport protein A [Ruminococcus sp.]|nr:ferrous iron transport protein A [Ruminococcus sp.]MCM1479071.1 ferrous iron transport protein A [Muribaculaceae bacterium]
MNTSKTLHGMREGTSAKVVGLMNEGSMRRRLQDIGLIEGTPVLCLQRSPSGDPIAYLIRGAVIALREEDSSKVLVE